MLTIIPQHIAITMDGNRRWAKSKSLPVELGHKAGSEAVERVAKECKRLGVKYLTLYTFSSENWNRSEKEVEALMDLLRSYLGSNVNKLIKSGMRILFIGDRSRLAPDIIETMEKVEAASVHNSFYLILAISYSGRDEIRYAAMRMAESLQKSQSLPLPDYFDQFISTNQLGIPDPDLLIRSGGEYRISNFLLWQIAYSELYFVDKYWPDFNADDLHSAIEELNKREKRYGK